MPWISAGTFSRRSCRCRLTFAGYRYAQAPSTSTRRAWPLPAFVIPPWRRRPPDEYSEGVDRKSTRLNSSHITISYAVFCLKKKKKKKTNNTLETHKEHSV